jgi:ABC-type transport system involved in cytochrome c biogenesis permease component
MTVLPIVARELGVAARRPGTYWFRFWAAGVALALFTFPCLTSRETITELGPGLFVFLSVIVLCLCMLSGVFLTADSLSAEKREGTLGLLFLTDLRGYDVVLGKMTANSLHAFFGLLAVFPVLALPLLSGGLSPGEFWRTLLVFLVTLFYSLGIGMLVSAISREGRLAMNHRAAGGDAPGALAIVFPVHRLHFDERAALAQPRLRLQPGSRYLLQSPLP